MVKSRISVSALVSVFVLLVPTLGVQPVQAQPSVDQIKDIIQDLIKPGTDKTPGNVTIPGTVTPPGKVRTIDNSDGVITRAMNLARQAAERANGGLSNYRAETAMYGPSEKAPYIVNGDNSLTFTFLGGRPALPPSIQSVVTVAADASTIRIDYNGPIPPPK